MGRIKALIHEEGKSASELSRKDEIFTSDSGLISIAGGKLTGYRKMAERVVNRVAEKFKEEYGGTLKECTTEAIPLCGNDFKKFKHVKKYIAEIAQRLVADGFTEYDAWYLVTTYGKQTDEILEIYGKRTEAVLDERLILSELQFGVYYEMVQNPLISLSGEPGGFILI